MKILLALLLFSGVLKTSGGTVTVAWDAATNPTKFTLYQQDAAGAKTKLMDNIPGASRAVQITTANNSWYTLTMTSTVTLGSTSTESSQSNVLQFQFIVPPVPIIRLQ